MVDRDERALLLTQFLNGMGYGLVFPVAAFTAENLGTTATVLTLVLAAHPLARLLSGPAWGALADRFGRRPVMLAGIALSGLGHLLFSLGGSVLALATARALTGLGTGDSVAAGAMIADRTTGAERAAGLGRLRASYGLGMLAGPLVGGVTALGGLAWPPRLAAALCAMNLVLAVAWLRETRRGEPAIERVDRRLLELPNVGPSLWIAFVATMAISSAEVIVALAIEHVLVPRVAWPWTAEPRDLALLLTVALIMIWGFTAAIVEGGLAGVAARWVGERPLIVGGLAAWAFAFALTPLAYLSGLSAGIVVLVLTAGAAGFAGTALGSLFSRSVPEASQGSGFGLFQSASALGEVVGPAIAGALFEAWFGLPYLVGAALLLTAVAAAGNLRQPV